MFGLGSIISGAIGALGGVLGSVSKNKHLREQEDLSREQERENRSRYDRAYNEDATQRADAQRLLSLTEDSIRRRNRAAAGTAAVVGGTDVSLAGVKDANSKALADAAGQIAAQAERRRDAVDNEYQRRKERISNEIRSVRSQYDNGLDILGSAIGGASGGVSSGMAIDEFWRKSKQ